MMRTLAACVVLTLGVSAGEQARPPAAAARQVYVEPMGQDHEAVRFRKLMSDRLTTMGFTIARDASTADLVLVTTLSTPVVGGETRAFASAEVRMRDGHVVWADEFPANDGWRQARGRGAVTKLAEEIVSAVQRRAS